MTHPSTIAKLEEAIARCRHDAFTEPSKACNYDALGILCANYCKWSGTEMRKVIYSMLEDANFHTLNAQIDHLWDRKVEAVQ